LYGKYADGWRLTGAYAWEKDSYQATWLDGWEIQNLKYFTHSEVPILRGDWFFAQTCLSADRGDFKNRKGFGYYDFNGIANRDDFFRLVGLDERRAKDRQNEFAAVILGRSSGVAQNDRVAIRLGADDGGAYGTLDFFDSNRDIKNPLRIIDRDKGLKHDAEEWFGFGPNFLWKVIACTDKGELQESAPDKIGPDKTAKGNDRRIHVSKSCFSCHTDGGLQDLGEDEVRATFTKDGKGGYFELGSVDFGEALKLKRILLRDLRPSIAKDRETYRVALAEATRLPEIEGDKGWTPAEAAAAIRDGYELYWVQPVTVAMVANELGCTPDDLTRKLVAFRSRETNYDPSLAPLLKGRSITRNNMEELYPTLQKIMRDYP
jgi:hypothetical protein